MTIESRRSTSFIGWLSVSIVPRLSSFATTNNKNICCLVTLKRHTSVAVEAPYQIAGDVGFAASVLPGDAAMRQAADKISVAAIKELWLVSDGLDVDRRGILLRSATDGHIDILADLSPDVAFGLATGDGEDLLDRKRFAIIELLMSTTLAFLRCSVPF